MYKKEVKDINLDILISKKKDSLLANVNELKFSLIELVLEEMLGVHMARVNIVVCKFAYLEFIDNISRYKRVFEGERF